MIPAPVYLALPYVAAVLLALAIPVATLIQYRLVRSATPDTRVIALLVLVAIGAMVDVALTPRTLNDQDLEAAGRQVLSDYAEGFAASRYFNVVIVGACVVELLRGWLESRARAVADPARPVLHGLLAFYVGTIAIQAAGSAHREFTYQSLYVPVVLLAAFYQRVTDLTRIVRIAKWAVLALMVASLAAIAVKPDFVLHRPEPGVIPGVDFRLYGLTPHANALGPMALIGLVLEAYCPSRPWLLRLLQIVTSTVVLALAQSKTAWVAGLAILVLVTLPLGLAPARGGRPGRDDFGRAVVTLLTCVLVLIVALVGLSQLDIVGYVERTAQVDTLTGRTQIWDFTLQGWRENYLFGYGREIWGAERMYQFRLFHVGQAHNQFVQALGESGLVGLAALLAYLGVLLHAAVSRFAASRGLVLSMLILVVARCVTEAPLRIDGVQSWPTFTNVLLVVFACHFLRGGRAVAATSDAAAIETGRARGFGHPPPQWATR